MIDEVEMWTDTFAEICNNGVDPAPLADAMLTTASLLVAQHRGNDAAVVQMMAGLNFLTRRQEQPTPEPGVRFRE